MKALVLAVLVIVAICPIIDAQMDSRRDSIKQAMKHSWEGYVQYGWGMDNMKTISEEGYNWLYMNLTVVDAIDTLWIMGLTDEYNDARAVIESYGFAPDKFISLFDVTMRVIGGLLSAHSLTGDELFLSKAEELERRLLPAYDTPSKIPYNSINPQSSKARPDLTTNLAQAGTCLMELYYLSHHTGDNTFSETAATVVDSIVQMPHDIPALYPIYIDPVTGKPNKDTVSIDCDGDSFYEYLVKTWVLLGGPNSDSEDASNYRGMWDDSMDATIEYLIKVSSPSSFYYTTSMTRNIPDNVMGHLGCYAAGMFALGANAFNSSIPNGNYLSNTHMQIAKELIRTCHETYISTATGIGPEKFKFHEGSDFSIQSPEYLLRPEVVESYFYLWRYTHDEMYRDWGWDAFTAINATCYAPAGFTDIANVDSLSTSLLNDQDPYFLAETLKYLYLLFSEDELVPLDKFVFTTEAHPLSIFV
ncbi:mannosyl-oligosaccharide 1,2-alpha-mannosidase IB [Pelomyxa schiedti]|nr:mannosyl-oligosaccharide 1,2-alpha-mannosidase IB [Pelomyxa schiedti]